jgi:hypothetical protein
MSQLLSLNKVKVPVLSLTVPHVIKKLPSFFKKNTQRVFRLFRSSRQTSHGLRTISARLFVSHCTFVWPCIVTNFFITKPTRCTNFTNLFWHETLHVSDSSSVHHQELIHCTLSNGICHTAVEQDQDGTAVPSWSWSKAVYKPVWHIASLSVQWISSWWWTEELSETCRVLWQ